VEVGGWVIYYIFMLILGVKLGNTAYFSAIQTNSRQEEKTQRFVKSSILVALLFVFPTFFSRVGDINFSGNLGEQYAVSAAYREANQGWFEYIRIFFSVYLFGFYPVFIYYYSILRRRWKILGVIAIALNIALAVFTGVNKYIFDILMVSLTIFTLKNFLLCPPNFRNIAKYAIAFVLLSGAALYFFAEGQSTRSGSAAIAGVNNRLDSTSEYTIDDGLLLMGYSAMTSYLTQGYRVFDFALEEQFKWTYGVGNSVFFSRQVDKLSGSSVSDESYPARVEWHGTDRHINWSTFYLWWASDVTFIGVGILMAIAGFLYRALENTLAKNVDIYVLVLYSYMTIGFFYLSANNQIFQSGESAVGFLCCLILVVKKRTLRFNVTKTR